MTDSKTTPIEDAENIQDPPVDQTAEEAQMDETPAQATAEGNVQGDAPDLEQALAAARKQAQEYFDGWQRERADFSNYKKRAERDLMTMRFNAKVDTLRTMLPILDDFERAMSSLPEDMKSNAWLEGVTAIQRKLLKTMEDEGVRAVDPTGELFDPMLHEAIGRDSDTDVASGHITVTLQKGYVCGDRVLRPAMVRVAE